MPSLRALLPKPVEHQLAPLSKAELEAVQPKNGVPAAGAHRALEMQPGVWTTLPDGRSVWRQAIRSPGAQGLRLHFRTFDVGRGKVWVHDGDERDPHVGGPYSGQGIFDNGEFWSDVILSERIVIEFEPEAGPPASGALPFEIAEISHLFEGVFTEGGDKAGEARRTVEACHLDVTCHPEWQDSAKAVARILFETSAGTFVCSGSLLNTRNSSFIPYFLTADHCVSTDAEARSVQAFWMYQTAACNAPPPDLRSVPRALGARYLTGRSKREGDFSLLRLNEVPSGVIFAGWSADEQGIGTRMTGIHHPTGDYKRISLGERVEDRPVYQPTSSFYTVRWAQGRTEGGSSGSPVFSSPGVVVGSLSGGEKLGPGETECGREPSFDYYGRFSVAYPWLRSYLDERSTVTPPPPPAATGAVLTSGNPSRFSFPAVNEPVLMGGDNVYRVDVPQGATRLEVRLDTATAAADLDLFVRFGTAPEISGGRVQADHSGVSESGNEVVVITPNSSPALQAGTYYIALAVFTTGRAIEGAVTATVTAEAAPPPPDSATPLASGVPQTFTLPEVTGPTLLRGAYAYKITVPEGATRLEIQLNTATPGVDVDLFARFGSEPVVSEGRVTADYSSSGPAGNETIVITPASSPALRAGTYYIAFGVFTPGRQIQGTLAATVTTGSTGQPPGAPAVLTSGVPQSFALQPVSSPTLLTGSSGYQITVPEGATQLEIRLVTTTPGVDVDLYSRFGVMPAVSDGSVVADHSSTGDAGDEAIRIGTDSDPPLRPGTYLIALAVFTRNVAIAGRLTATVQMGDGTTATLLIPGASQTFRVDPVSSPRLLTSHAYRVVVPEGATRLDVRLTTATRGADMDLFVRFGRMPEVIGGDVVADYSSTSNSGDEAIAITPSSSPALRAGTYYIVPALFTTGVQVESTLNATVTSAAAPPAPTILNSGVAGKFHLPAVSTPTLFSGDWSYRINVPEGATRLSIRLASSDPETDVDLFVRAGSDPDVEDGEVVADHSSEGETGNETIIIDASSSPPLRPGVYHIALALYSTGRDATGSITATWERAPAAVPAITGRLLLPGVPAGFELPAVNAPTLFTGDRVFRVEVPENGRIDVRLRTGTSGADVDVFIRQGTPPAVVDGRVVADYSSTSAGTDEFLSLGPQSTPPLRPGVYYIALALYSTGIAADGTVTVDVSWSGTKSTTGSHSQRVKLETMPVITEPGKVPIGSAKLRRDLQAVQSKQYQGSLKPKLKEAQ